MYTPRRHENTYVHYLVDGESHSISIADLIREGIPLDSEGKPCEFSDDFVYDEDGNQL